MSNLVKVRARLGINQSELAKRAGQTRAAVCYIEKSTMNASQAEKYAKALGCNRFEVIGLDVLKIIPETAEEKRILLDLIDKIEVK